MDVLPIKGSDECLIQLGQNGVGQFIAVAFNSLNPIDLFVDVAVIAEQIDQRARAGNQIVGHGGEHREETVIPGNEAKHLECPQAPRECLCLQSGAVIGAGHYLTEPQFSQIVQRVVTARIESKNAQESRASPCETRGMANYTPKIGDRIVLNGRTGKFVVVGLDVPRMTADVRSIVGEEFLQRNVPWEAISDLEEGQDSGQTIREVTKDK